MEKRYKIVVNVPEGYTDNVRKAMGDAGAGKIGNYSHCSFSVKGVGRFKVEVGANPAIGAVGAFEEVAEERIESFCTADILHEVLSAIKQAHPYEEPAIDVYAVEVV